AHLEGRLRRLRQADGHGIRGGRQPRRKGPDTGRRSPADRTGLAEPRRPAPVPRLSGERAMKHCLPVALAIALLGCAADPLQLEQERSYRVEWLGERPLIDRSHLTLTLGTDGRAYGTAGCNHWFASYELSGQQLRFGAVGSTRKLCAPALMEQEQRFLDALSEIRRWDVSPIDQLRLWPAEGKPIRLWPEEG